MEFNPYKVLSLSKDASLEDIKKDIRNLPENITQIKVEIHSFLFILIQHIKYYLITN